MSVVGPVEKKQSGHVMVYKEVILKRLYEAERTAAFMFYSLLSCAPMDLSWSVIFKFLYEYLKCT